MSGERPLAAVLLDVEGTTTAISFVSDVLFPFARARVQAALAEAAPGAPLAGAAEQLRAEWEQDASLRARLPHFGSGAAAALALMDEDRKSTALKAVQGLLWEEGYRDGSLRAHVFDDVPVALRRWRERGLRVYIFSSGSVLAQRLLFAHTSHGDLGSCIDGYFDTTTGPKREPGAYTRIAREIGAAPGGILFLSDVPAELDAARAAGFRTGLVERPGNAPVAETSHPRHADLASLPV